MKRTPGASGNAWNVNWNTNAGQLNGNNTVGNSNANGGVRPDLKQDMKDRFFILMRDFIGFASINSAKK